MSRIYYFRFAHLAIVCFGDNICAAKTVREEKNKQTFIFKLSVSKMNLELLGMDK